MTLNKNASAAEATPTNEETDDLAIVRDQTRETLELVRALVSLLLPKADAKKGPTLEELIAALVAQQRDSLLLLRQLEQDIGAVLERLPASESGGTGHARENGHSGPNGRARA